jgi:hypothetical protein
MNWSVPTIAGIQRLTALLAAIVALILLAVDSTAAALSSLAGGLLMMVNLYVLVVIGRALVTLAQSGGAGRIGVALAPFKLLLLSGAVYLLVTRLRLDLLGFLFGSLTQLVAIFIETGRVSWLAGAPPPRAEKGLPEDLGV